MGQTSRGAALVAAAVGRAMAGGAVPVVERRATAYSERIRQYTGGLCDPLHVEAYMRVGHSTLDGLGEFEFRQEVRLAMECIAVGGLAAAERCAASFGLVQS